MYVIKVYVLLILATLTFPANAQETDSVIEERKFILHPQFSCGILAGGQISNGRFIYKTGKFISIGLNYQISNRVYYGITAGVNRLKNETFIPVTLSFVGLIKNKPVSPFITAQLGYAPGFNEKLYSFLDYKYNGGLTFSPGFGYKFSIGSRYSVMSSVNYIHQFAHVKYFGPENEIYRDENSLSLLSFSIGLLF